MGSGISGNYGGGSQPYAPTYNVVREQLDRDKRDPTIYNPKTGYFKNPTATHIDSAIRGNRILIDEKRPSGPITYVLDNNGNLIIGKRLNPYNSTSRAPHPTLIGGKNPEVQCAGMIRFSDGRILSANANSGHFRPNKLSLDKVNAVLDRLYEKNPYLFDRRSRWRKKHD